MNTAINKCAAKASAKTLNFSGGEAVELYKAWRAKNKPKGAEPPKVAIKCDMCIGKSGGPACVRACPTGAAIRVSPEEFLTVKRMNRGE